MIQTEQLGLRIWFYISKVCDGNTPWEMDRPLQMGKCWKILGTGYLFGQKSKSPKSAVWKKRVYARVTAYGKPPEDLKISNWRFIQDGFESVKLCALRVLRKMCPMNDGDMEVVVGRMWAFPAFRSGDLNKLSWVSFPATYYWYQLANRQIWGASLADFLRLRSTKKDMGCLDAYYCNY